MRPKANPVGNPRTAKSVEPAKSFTPVSDEIPKAPSNLGPIGQSVWTDLWTAGQGVYHPSTDCYPIERYCKLQEKRLELEARVESEGYTVVGSQGQDVLNPLVRVVQDVETKLLSLEKELGLTPEARLRLGITAIEQKSALEDFMERFA